MKVLVIGDSCTDKFIYCVINRICPEAPVPVLQPINEVINPGMAGNVAANLKALGADIDLITNDETIKKTRFVDIKSNQMIMRLDENDNCKHINTLYWNLDGYDAIIISDYCKGFLKEDDITTIALQAKCPIFLDTKKKLGSWCKNIDFIKINKPEWDNNSHYKGSNIIVTDGKNGATYKDIHYPVNKEVLIKDVSGAGDTFLSGLVIKYLENKNIKESIIFANECATKVVQKRGVTTI